MTKKEILFLTIGILTGASALLFTTIPVPVQENNVVVGDTLQGARPYFGHSSSPPIPAELSFAGEKVDLDKWYIRERLERELVVASYSYSLTLMSLKRAGRWLPMIEDIFKREGVPDDLKYLVIAESNLTNAISPAEAVGFWQILEKTGKSYGLIINKEVDQRYDPVKATLAAVKYLKRAKDNFGSWTLAAAAYNAGMRGIGSKLEAQGESDYFSLHMADETARYVFRAMAYKLIHQNPDVYGYFLSQDQYYKPLRTYEIEVTGTVQSWITFAKAEGITYAQLKYYNPWIRDSKLVNKNRDTFIVKIPVSEVR
ncbi:MAG: murein transglycosylase [Ignavibacteriales bacterium]